MGFSLKKIVKSVTPILGITGAMGLLGKGTQNNILGTIGSTGEAITGYMGAKETNKANKEIAQETNAFNSAEAQANRDWQTEMSNTAHQREVADLQAAGLNPVLSAGGSGATTPTGATATGILPAPRENKIASALALKNMYEQNELLKAQTNLTKEQTKYTGYFPETTSGGGSILGIGGQGLSTKYKRPGENKSTTIEIKPNSAMKIAKALMTLKR